MPKINSLLSPPHSKVTLRAMAVYQKHLPCLPVGSNFFGLNRMDKSVENRFAGQNLWVRPVSDGDYTRGSLLLNRIQGRTPSIQFTQQERRLLLEAYMVNGDEEKLSKIIHILSRQCSDHFHLDVPKSISYTILSSTLPSIKQTALWCALLSQWHYCQPFLTSGDRKEGLSHIEARLFGVALATARWPKNKQVLLDQLELALVKPYPCPYRRPGTNYWDGWCNLATLLPPSIREACMTYVADAEHIFVQKFPLAEMLEDRHETGFCTTTNLGISTFRPSTKHREALLQDARPKVSPVHVEETRKRYIPSVFSSNARHLHDEVTYKEAFHGFVRFFAAYRGCRHYGSRVPDEELASHSAICHKLWRLVRYFLTILIHPSRSSKWAVVMKDHDTESHPLSRLIQCWLEEWQPFFAEMETSGALNIHDLDAVVMARIATVGPTLFQSVLRPSHPFFRHPASLVWGLLFSISSSHSQRLHLVVLCELWLQGCMEDRDLWAVLINICRFMTEPEWHNPDDNMMGEAESLGRSDDMSDEPSSVSPESLVEPLAIVDLEAVGKPSSALVHGATGHVVMGAKVQDWLARGHPRASGGLLEGYVDRVCKWVVVPSTPPPYLFATPFASLMAQQLRMLALPTPLMIVPDLLMDLESPSFMHSLLDRSWEPTVQPVLGPHLLYVEPDESKVEGIDETMAFEKQVQVGIHWNAALLSESLGLRGKKRGDMDLDDAVVLSSFSYRNLGRAIGEVFGRSWSGPTLVWHALATSPSDPPSLTDADAVDAYAKEIVEAWHAADTKPAPAIAYHIPDITTTAAKDPFDSDEENVESNRKWFEASNKLLANIPPSEGADVQMRMSLARQKELGISGKSGHYVKPSDAKDKSYAEAYNLANIKREARGLPPIEEEPTIYETIVGGKDEELPYKDHEDTSSISSTEDEEEATRPEPPPLPSNPRMRIIELDPKTPVAEKRKRRRPRQSTTQAKAQPPSSTSRPSDDHIKNYLDLLPETITSPQKKTSRKNAQEWKNRCRRHVAFRPPLSGNIRTLAHDIEHFPICLGPPDMEATLVFCDTKWYWLQRFKDAVRTDDPHLQLWYQCASMTWKSWVVGELSPGPQIWQEPTSKSFMAAIQIPAPKRNFLTRCHVTQGYNFMAMDSATTRRFYPIMSFFNALPHIKEVSDRSKSSFYSMLYWIIFPRAFGYIASAQSMGFGMIKDSDSLPILVPVMWDLRPFSYKDDGETSDIVTFFLGGIPFVDTDLGLRAMLGRLFGVGFSGRAHPKRLDYIKEIFNQAYEMAPSLGLKVDDQAFAMFERIRATLR